MGSVDADQSIGFLVSDVSRLMRRVYDKRVEPLGLTRSQWRVLVHLYRREGVRQTELAAILEIEKPTVGRLLDQLERKGWVERRVDPTDQRARIPAISDRARGLIDRMTDLAESVQDDALRGMSEADAERLTSLLLAVKLNLLDLLAANGADEPATTRPEA